MYDITHDLIWIIIYTFSGALTYLFLDYDILYIILFILIFEVFFITLFRKYDDLVFRIFFNIFYLGGFVIGMFIEEI